MAVESAADRRAFVSAADFGTTILWTVAATSSAILIDAIFDDADEVVGDGAAFGSAYSGGVVASRARLDMAADDLPASSAVGDIVTVDATDYRVEEIRRDGTGMVSLALSLA